MAKTPEEVKELLSTELFKKGIKDKHIVINDDMFSIKYNCKNANKPRRLLNPEEPVQAEAFLKLIYEYKYLPQNISVNESVQMGSDIREADILVYNDKNNKFLSLSNVKRKTSTSANFR